MRFALCQMNPTIGAMTANAQKILTFCAQAHTQGADFVISPELSVCGYPPKDLLFRPEFTTQVTHALAHIAQNTKVPVLVGATLATGLKVGAPFYNAAILCFNGKAKTVARKTLLPNYDVFDENRFFEPWTPACGPNILEFGNLKIGISICEDAWNYAEFEPSRWYLEDPMGRLTKAGANLIINMSASPFSQTKPFFREQVFSGLAQQTQLPIILVCQVGAQDQLIFDGTSLAINRDGSLAARLASFKEELAVVDLGKNGQLTGGFIASLRSDMQMLNDALVLGISDYVKKCGASGLIIGLSGGVDSAVTAALATQAVGAENVLGVRMPSTFSSSHSLSDAEALATNLGIELRTIPIEDAVASFRKILEGEKLGNQHSADISDQNLQARARGVILMGLSNLTGKLVLATGNKSELAVGYTTLYGDMCGALSPIADLYKTEVWQLAISLNLKKEIIPTNTIEKPPSAELKNDQADQDNLPQYPALDSVLKMYVDDNLPLSEIVAQSNLGIEEIKRIIEMIHHSEYKRWQGATCLIVSKKAFGDGRRWPIAQQFDEFC